MSDDSGADAILKFSQSLLRSRRIGGSLVVSSGRLGAPLAVRSPDGTLHSWFVPVAVKDRLAGFLQVLPDLTLMRYAAFQRREDSLEGCPAAASWTDVAAIRRVAREQARSGETVGVPVLTYDREPSRLAWSVPLTSPGKGSRTLLVAGEQVWEARARDDGGDSYGGPPPR